MRGRRIGKTSLALRLAAELAADFPDGTWFVDLSELQQPDLVASRIASVIGVLEEPGRPLLATLADALRPRRMLIVLDNCEHLIDACAQVCQRLLASSAGLQVIATSREPLRVAAETVWQVPPMAMPRARGRPDAELIRSDAVRLFADRAAAVKPDFELGPANLASAAGDLPCRRRPAAGDRAGRGLGHGPDRRSRSRPGSGTGSAAQPAAGWPRRGTARCARPSTGATTCCRRRRRSCCGGWPSSLVAAGSMAEQVCAGQVRDGRTTTLAAGEVLALLTGLADKSLVVAEPGATAGSGTGCSTRSASTRPRSWMRPARPSGCGPGSATTRCAKSSTSR